jgi:hypothetical protein
MPAPDTIPERRFLGPHNVRKAKGFLCSRSARSDVIIVVDPSYAYTALKFLKLLQKTKIGIRNPACIHGLVANDLATIVKEEY